MQPVDGMPRNDPQQAVAPSGMAWTWWRGDPLPDLEPIPNLASALADADAALAQLNRVSHAEVLSRVQANHRPYVARVGSEAVAYGWVASRAAGFGDGRCEFEVPAFERYLWDFATVPAWRGRGIYPRLLQAIIAAEEASVERFWILHEWSNEASKHGIARAGFQAAATVYELPDGKLGLGAIEASDRAEACARLLGLPLLSDEQTQLT
jgi:GNAT superfamily N-acetyltransferase